MPEELAYFLRNGLFADPVSYLVKYFFQKNLSWIHFDRNQINPKDDKDYES